MKNQNRVCPFGSIDLLRSFVLGAAWLLGCGGSDVDAASSEQNPYSGPLLEACSGSYVCAESAGSKLDVTLSKREGACYAGSMLVPPSGTSTSADGVEFSWSGDASSWKFSLTSGKSLHFVCTPNGAAPPPKGSSGQCTGIPSSCSSSSPPGCGKTSGCSMRSMLRWDGSWNNYCDGVPDLCSEMSSEDSCKAQGCKWQ